MARTRWSPLALTFTSRTNVFALQAFKQGLFEVQDEGSQLIAEACGVRPGQPVVDAWRGRGRQDAGAGGADENKGRLVACDCDGRRLLELKQRARRAGVHNWSRAASRKAASGAARIRRTWSARPMWC